MPNKEIKVIDDYVDIFCEIDGTLQKKLAKQLIVTLFEQIKEDVKAKYDVRINNFGSFKLKTKAARKFRNPQNGDVIDVPEKQVIAFKPSKKVSRLK